MSAQPERIELREVRGPSALGGGWKRFGELLYLVSVTEFKKTYFGTVLGYVWSVLRPLLLFAVLLFVFTKIVRIGSDVPNYPGAAPHERRPLRLLLGGDAARR